MKLGTLRVIAAAFGLVHAWGQTETLPQLIDGILAKHPSLRAQQALNESARQAVESAAWQFYPTPSVEMEQTDPGYADTSYPSYGDKSVTTLRLQQPLWTGGRLTAGLNKAQAGLTLSQTTADGIRQDLALRVVQLYADWLTADLKILAFEKSLQAHHTLEAQIDRRIAGGASPRSDLTLLRGRAQQTEADLAAAQAQAQSALGRLGQLLDHPLQADALAQSVATPLDPGGSVQELLADAREHSPAVRKLQAQASVALGEIQERRAGLLPEVYLRLESQYGNFVAPGSPTQNRIFVGVSSHLGAGLSSLSDIGDAQARYHAALDDIESTRLSLAEQIQADYAQVDAGRARLLALEASRDASDAIAQAWSRQFIAGRKTWLDVMNAMREQTQLETQIADATSAQLLLTWRLAIVGRGLEQALARAVATPAPAQAHSARADAPDSAPGHLAQALPLYAGHAGDGADLRMAAEIDPATLGVRVVMDRMDPADRQEFPEGSR